MTNLHDLDWDYPEPFFIERTVGPTDIDGFDHTNNTVYLQWLDQCTWAHTEAVGLSAENCVDLNRGMAVIRHEIDYLISAKLDDPLVIGDWVTANDGRLRAQRQYQIIRVSDGRTLLRAKTDYICTDLKRGRPARMPEEFIRNYPVLPGVAAKLASAPNSAEG